MQLIGSLFALSVTATPLTLFGSGVWVVPAFAKDGSSGHGSGSGGGGHSGSDHSGKGGDDDGGGGGGSGPGRGDDGANHDRGDDRGVDAGRGDEHINPANGAKVEIAGSNIEVVHANGFKEELENGRYEKKDAAGKTIVERAATAADIKRLTAMAN
ncbi:hypothetical protein SAZ10_11600 [Mesorhizobium sp. BAC0120]|uniref:hypothetical protein n=1 Tax=Mesorhizobium sp. BAC0120 TaxID=3090670 RepID=UPI00298D4748|nr:hypothetical protein [Mesorhizobium sp. BAC0120]MDW6022398.1 hypothetical protein [Mesorhizobium sp. BAC0120]